MNSPLESGLFLPLRFYNTLAEQDRYKRMSQGVTLVDEVYIHANCTTLLPYQVILNEYAETINAISVNLICIDTNESISVPINYDTFEVYADAVKQKTWVSYLGNDDYNMEFGNGKYYIELLILDENDYTNYFFSDIFVIRNCENAENVTSYLGLSTSSTGKLVINAGNLKIF